MYTTQQKAERFIDIKAINSLLCAHCLYFGRRQGTEELEELWCKEAPNPSFSQNNGSFVGYEALKTIYAPAEQKRKEKYDAMLAALEPEFADQDDTLRYGTNVLSLQTLSTPCIELSEDGTSAKGLWTVSAQVTAVGDDGPEGFWAYGKLGADLIKEHGQWKIWHLTVCTDFLTPAGKAFDPERGRHVYAPGLGIDETPTHPEKLYEYYSEFRKPQNFPTVPLPYTI